MAMSLLYMLGISAGVILVGTALFFGASWLWRKARWALYAVLLLVLVGGLVALFEFVLPRHYPTIDPALPIFRPFVWTWMLVFTLIALGTLGYVVRAIWRHARNTGGEMTSGRHPDLDAAWEAILLRLGQAEIDPATQRFILLLAPNGTEAEAVVRAAGLSLYAEAPPPGAPIRMYATAEAVLLSVGDACTFARQDPIGTDRLEYLCDRLNALDPECSVVRGVVVVFPTNWAAQAEAPRWAAAVREDLRVLGASLHVRSPVFAILGRMEEIEGLNEFVARMPETFRAARCGFAIPSSHPFTGELISRGLSWLSGWFETWCLNLMAGNVLDTRGNGRLYLLTDEVRRRRRRWRDVMEAAFSTHREAQPVPLRGCYGVVSSAQPGGSAFASGLLRGARSRIISETITAEWGDEAFEDDRRYRRAALLVGLIGGGLALLAWTFIVQQQPIWWIAFLLVIVAWIAVLTRMHLRSST